MTTIQILIVAFVVLSFAYLILKVWDDIRENNAERKQSKPFESWTVVTLPKRDAKGRFLPKIQTATEALAIEKSRQMGITSAIKHWTLTGELKPFPKPKNYKTGPVDVSDELFPKRGKDGKFVKAMPKARVDNFKGI